MLDEVSKESIFIFASAGLKQKYNHSKNSSIILFNIPAYGVNIKTVETKPHLLGWGCLLVAAMHEEAPGGIGRKAT
ncbi:MAG TPA: hypothetical protein VLT37_07670 [Acidocella sp.]|nr:hypothetical protein [Acidocella sp.]